MVTHEIITNPENGTQYVKIYFEVISDKTLTNDQWNQVNNRIEDLVQTLNER